MDKGWIKDSFLYTRAVSLLAAPPIHIPFIQWLALWIIPFPFFMLRVKQPVSAMVVPLFGGSFHHVSHRHSALVHPARCFAGCVGVVMGSLYAQTRMTGTDVVLGGLVSGLIVSVMTMSVMQWAFGFFDRLNALWLNEWHQAKKFCKNRECRCPGKSSRRWKLLCSSFC